MAALSGASRNGGADTVAVDAVSLSIPSGALFFLLGPSGCGKTTLLRMIAGFTFPSEGRILFDAADMSQTPPHLRDTGMVFQSYALWPHMTVAENVAFGLDSRKVKNPQRAQRIEQALAMVQLQDLADRKPNQLSGGQQQRVALARALAIRPSCLLLDEPLSNLDAKLRLEMRSEIRRIVKQSGTTAIYVTHDQKEALSMADGIAVMNAGKLQQDGTPADLYRKPRTRFVANFIGESNFLDATIDSVSAGTILLKTAAGPLMAPREPDWTPTPNQKVTVAFRPESASLAADDRNPGTTVNRLQGSCVASTYLGEIAEYTISFPGLSLPVKVFELNPKPASNPPGTRVTVLLPQEHVMILREP